MTSCVIYVRDYSNRGDYRYGKDWLSFMSEDKDPDQLTYLLQDNYSCPANPIQTHLDGEDAAEEMFDLTNNPSRQDERLDKYGRHQSLSVGDIVHVVSRTDDSYYLCRSFGWKKIA